MEEFLLDQSYRKQVIREIKSDENIQRKIVSYKKHNMQNDNFYQYVVEYLEAKLDPETVQELDIFANVNLQKRISKSESSIYKNEPERKFYIGEAEIEEVSEMYKKMDINTVLKRANEAYKYQEQCSIQIYPEDQKLKARVLLPHHFDVIPDPMNPEKALAYIISNFDNTSRDRIRKDYDKTGFSQGDKYRDNVNQEIGDPDDSMNEGERYYLFSESFNFVMNGKGEILLKEDQETPLDVQQLEEDPENENIVSPLKEFGCLPFIDVSKGKEFEFWVRSGDTLYDATVMYNVILTSEFQTVKMQGHAQPYYKGDAEHLPENIRIGVDKMIFIPINPNNPVGAEFGFANPGSDLAGIREFRESFLSAFLSSRGLDTNIVSGSSSVQTASSGIEKMLQMVEKFEASQEDFSLFQKVEDQLMKIVACYIRSYYGVRKDGDLMLDECFQLRISDPKDANIKVEFSKPEMIKTEMEILDVLEREIDLGLSSRVHYLMEHKGMSLEQAKKHIEEVDEFEGLSMGNNNKEAQEPNKEEIEGEEDGE